MQFRSKLFAAFSAGGFLLSSGTPAFADEPSTGYEQCHLLCSNEQGRSELRLIPGNEIPDDFKFGYRVESYYIQPTGHYEEGRFVGLEPGAKTYILEVLPSFWYRPSPDLQVNFTVPIEGNRSEGIVLPTLHPVSGPHSELNLGGLIGSVHYRVQNSAETGSITWLGVGYKLSKESGTDDVGPDIAQFPDKKLEALGIGSDDIFAIIRHKFPRLGAWTFGAGGEYRFQMLPRFDRHFATTVGYQVWTNQQLSESWGASLRLTGFYSKVHSLDVTQTAPLIVSLQMKHALDSQNDLTLAVNGEVPGANLNQNVIQTIGPSVSLVHHQ